MRNQDKVPIRFYSEFYGAWDGFPETIQEELCSFLEDLQQNPDDPKWLSKCETDVKGRFGYQFAQGYAVYWRVKRNRPKVVVDLESGKPLRIEILEVCRLTASRSKKTPS